MYLADFQLCLRVHDFDRYGKCRTVWGPLELRVRRAIPKRFVFGGVKKVVIELGPDSKSKPHYRELLNVGLLHYPSFIADDFLVSAPQEQRRILELIVGSTMSELSARFSTPIPWLRIAVSASLGDA
jgi:hypothetical protein